MNRTCIFSKSFEQLLSQISNRFPVGFLCSSLQSPGKGECPRNINRAGALTSLVTSTMLLFRNWQARFRKQETDTLWPMKLVSRRRKQIHFPLNKVDGYAPEPLRCIGVTEGPDLLTGFCNLGNGLKCPNFIIGSHHRHKKSVLRELGL